MCNGDYLPAILGTMHLHAKLDIYMADNSSWGEKKIHNEISNVYSLEYSKALEIEATLCNTELPIKQFSMSSFPQW